VKKKFILKSMHGSHLYGMATPLSDLDTYEIYDFCNQNYRPKKQAKQNIHENEDNVSISLQKYREYCLKGVPQTVEVAFADQSKWIQYDVEWHNIRNELQKLITHKKCLPDVLETYRRTALSFMRGGDFKRFRHALRLCINARELKETGKMNPTLNQDDIDRITVAANAVYREDLFYTKYYSVFE